MAVVILGGLVTSTFLNMIVIPALYLKFGRAEAHAPERTCLWRGNCRRPGIKGGGSTPCAVL